MPLALRLLGSRCAPVIVCDQCHHPIESGDDGNYEWPSFDDRGLHHVYFAHKGCTYLLEARIRKALQLPVEAIWATMPLRMMPLFLANNLKVDMETAAEDAQLFASIS